MRFHTYLRFFLNLSLLIFASIFLGWVWVRVWVWECECGFPHVSTPRPPALDQAPRPCECQCTDLLALVGSVSWMMNGCTENTMIQEEVESSLSHFEAGMWWWGGGGRYRKLSSVRFCFFLAHSERYTNFVKNSLPRGYLQVFFGKFDFALRFDTAW